MKKSDMDFLNKISFDSTIDWITDNHSQVLKNGVSEVAKLVAETLRQVKSILDKDTDVTKSVDKIAKIIRLSSYEHFPNAKDNVADTASCIALAVSAWLVEKLSSIRSTDIAMNLFGKAADLDKTFYDSHDFMSILEEYDDEAEAFINNFMDSDEDGFTEEIKKEDDSPKETYTNKYNNNFEKGSNPIILQDAKIEKIEINGSEKLHSKITKMVRDKIENDNGNNNSETLEQTDSAPREHTKDEKLSHAIKVLEASKEFKNKSDYAWIFRALVKEGILSEGTSTPDFMKTMKEDGSKKIPASPTSINRFLTTIDNDDKVGDFTFTDTTIPNEIQRRNNVMKIFIAAYNKF